MKRSIASMDYLVRAREVFEVEIAGLRAVSEQLDERFVRAVDWTVETLAARGKLIIAGIGKSGHIGRKIAATLTSTGSTCVVLDSVDALHGDLGIVSDGDLVLLLSYSGESEEVLNLVPALKRYAVRLVTLTGNLDSTLARLCDLALSVRVPKEACPFNLAPTASTTAMLALGDALAMTLLEARGFKKEDFARHHPSGAIGRALLLKVREIMRTEVRNPVATRDLSVRAALLIMTRAKAGSVSVVDADGRLVGVFTDGDLRRHMAGDEAVLDRTLEAVMTHHPVCISEDALAVEALRIFNERSIDDLIVVNANQEPVGLVDSQDLPRLKLM